MATFLKQSTAIDVSVGPFVDAGDGVTVESGLTITQPDIRLKKNGGAWAQKNAAQTLSHEENGWYEIALDTTDTNTLGNLLIAVNESGALPVWREFQVMPANVWDSLFGADKLQVHADEITAGLITAAAIATGAIDADALAADAVTEIAAGITVPTAAAIADAVWDEDLSAHASTPASTAEALSFLYDNLPLVEDIANVVWEEALADHSGTAGSTAEALSALPTAADNAAAILAADFEQDGEAGINVGEGLRVITAALAGKLSGAGTGTEVVRNFIDTKDRITYTVDTDGNRSAVTTDLT